LRDQFSSRVDYRSVINSLEEGNETYIIIKLLITMSVEHTISLIFTLPLSTAMLAVVVHSVRRYALEVPSIADIIALILEST
jgi:hypothetical protein